MKKPLPRKSRKSLATKVAVVAKALSGESDRQISRDMKIAENTVKVILKESEIKELLEQGKSNTYQLIPKIVREMEYSLDKHNANTALRMAEGIGLLQAKSEAQQADSGVKILIVNKAYRPEHEFKANGNITIDTN